MSAARRAAWGVLAAWLVADPARARLGTTQRPFPPPELATRDRALARDIAEGVVRRLGSLDAVLSRLTEGRKARPAGLRAALLIAGWELLFASHDAGQHAVVNDAVNLARRAAGEGGARFANAILRRLSDATSLEDWLVPPTADDREGLAEWYSLPPLVVERWHKAFGSEGARGLFEHTAHAAHRSLRVHRSARIEDVEASLQSRGFETARGPAPRCLLVTKEKGSLLETPDFVEGRIAMQDSTQIEVADLVLELVASKGNARILDYCAAPGTKACAIAEGLPTTSRIVAHDVQTERLARVATEAQRLGVAERIEVREELGDDLHGSFDVVLVDAPCTNSGVLARRAEARWRMTDEALHEHVRQQRELLESAAAFVAPGAMLVYSTCSIEVEENEELTRSFAESAGFRTLSAERVLPELGVRDGGGVAVLVAGAETSSHAEGERNGA